MNENKQAKPVAFIKDLSVPKFNQLVHGDGPWKGPYKMDDPLYTHPVPIVAQEPVAWERKWHFDGITPKKEKNENNRLAWPKKFQFLPISEAKIFRDDIPLYRATQPAVAVSEPWYSLLYNLVEGLNKTNWSSWQTTAHFQQQLNEAEAAIASFNAEKKGN